MSVRIVVDDEERDQCPDRPWTATIYVSDPTRPDGWRYATAAAGLGATPAEAVADVQVDDDDVYRLLDGAVR